MFRSKKYLARQEVFSYQYVRRKKYVFRKRPESKIHFLFNGVKSLEKLTYDIKFDEKYLIGSILVIFLEQLNLERPHWPFNYFFIHRLISLVVKLRLRTNMTIFCKKIHISQKLEHFVIIVLITWFGIRNPCVFSNSINIQKLINFRSFQGVFR